jgi:hypothetical protein
MDNAVSYLESSHPSLLGNDVLDPIAEPVDEIVFGDGYFDSHPLRAVIGGFIRYATVCIVYQLDSYG